jgi:mRNA interferase RelE/StbE
MEYQIRIKKSAIKELSKLPKPIATKISKEIDRFKTNPYPKGYKKLKGSENNYRLRIGNYRILYSIYNDILVIEVVKIALRKDIYKK